MIWLIALTVCGGFINGDGRFTLYYVLNVFDNPVLVQGLVNSLVIAVLTTGLCLVITLPLAVWAARYEFAGKWIVTSMMLVPLILPPFVGAIGLRAILGRFGALNALLVAWGIGDWSHPIDWLGGDWLPDVWPVYFLDGKMMSVVVMEVLHLYPILFLNIIAAIANIDPTLDEASHNLGVGRWMRFRKVTIPLIAPGLFAGGTIVFIWSFTELGTLLMFDYYRVMPVQIFWGINQV